MRELENPARRLHRICDRVRTSKAHDEKSIDVWAELLGLSTSEEDKPLVLRRLGLLIALFRQAEAAIEELHDEKKQIYREALRSLGRMVDYDRLFHNWQETKKIFDGNALKHLVLLAVDLEERDASLAERFDPKELDRLLGEVNELISEVLKSDIEEDLKRFIVEQLRKITDAILDYRFQGTSALVEALDSIYRATWARYQSNPEEWKSAKSSESVGRFVGVLSKLEKLLSRFQIRHPKLADASGKLIGVALKYLTDGTDGL